VLVVDDSAVIRSIIADSVGNAPGMKVVGTAANGVQALELFESLRPDVVTLDVQMPQMDGLATLDALFARRPVPVVMVSSLTKLGAKITFDALDRGALDYVAKPDYGPQTKAALCEELPRKIRNVAGADVRRILEIRRQKNQQQQHRPRRPSRRVVATPSVELRDKCVAIGISTGGPPALATLFESLRPPMPPIVVVQHMPPSFTNPLAWRLDSLSELAIKEAAQGDTLVPNRVLIAPGGKHLQVRRQGTTIRAVLSDAEPVSGHKPSVDALMHSVVAAYGRGCLGVIMTGMGHDGADGCRAIRQAGGYVLGQDEDSSAVYGMNKVAHAQGHVNCQFALDEAASVITQQVRRLWLAGVRV